MKYFIPLLILLALPPLMLIYGSITGTPLVPLPLPGQASDQGLCIGGSVFIVAILALPLVGRGRMAHENGFEPVIWGCALLTVAAVTCVAIVIGMAF